MAIKTTLEQLEEVQAAITKALDAQSYGIGSRNLSRAMLRDLQNREEILLRRYRAEAGTGGIAVNIAIPKRDY